MTVASVLFLIVSIFMLIPLVLAEFARNKTRNTTSDFFLQDRRMKLFPMYATVFATWMSAYAYMGAIAYFKEAGPVYLTSIGWDALFAVLYYVLGRRIWFYGKQYNYITATDFFADLYRFPPLQILVTAISIIFTMLYIDMQMIGGLVLLQQATGNRISWQLAAALFFVILVIYLWAGGLRAVALTDIFYGALIIITILASGFFLLHAAGGMQHVFTTLVEQYPQKVSLAGDDSFHRAAMWICLFLVLPCGLFMEPQHWIRCYASGSRKNFEKLPLLLCLSSVVIIGTLLAGSVGILQDSYTGSADTLLARMIVETASPFFSTFVFIGIASAIFSTANSQIHAVATVLTVNVYCRLFKNLPEKRKLYVAKWAVIFVSTIAYFILLIIPKSMFNTAIFAAGGTAQLILPVIGALFWERSSAKWAFASILTGMSIFIGALLFTHTDTSICAAWSLLANAAVFFLGSLVTEPQLQTAQKIRAYRRAFQESEYQESDRTTASKQMSK